MTRISRIALCSFVGLLFLCLMAHSREARGEKESTEQAIEFLTSVVAQSHLTFIRNGDKHTADEAVKHMRQKYDYLQSRVKSPEDFISLCASKSFLSGKPYLVVTEQGTIPVQKWLEQKLAEHVKSLEHL